MDQKKNQGQQPDRPRGQGHQPHEEKRHDMPSSETESREKGRGDQGERNLGGGISNRDVDHDLLEEQDEMADRDRQSER
ncbi:MAG: hypothetical protein ABW292_00605 [Vicinamibacterales bacterium]